MNKGRFVFTLASAALLAGGALAGLDACSSSTSDGGSSSGSMTMPEGSTVKETGAGGDSSMPPDEGGSMDAGSDCGKPASLHPNAGDGGIYCPFSAPAGGKNVYCKESEQCCETAKGGPVSYCVAKGTACNATADTAWECEDPVDCAGAAGKVCCAHSGDGGTVTVNTDMACGTQFLSKFSGTSCKTACAAGELVVCEKQADCTTGTCTAVKPKGNDIGVCKQ